MTNQRNLSTERKLAKYLARKIFEFPAFAEPKDIQRLVFMDVEGRDYGGVIEDALTKLLEQALIESTIEPLAFLGTPAKLGDTCIACGGTWVTAALGEGIEHTCIIRPS